MRRNNVQNVSEYSGYTEEEGTLNDGKNNKYFNASLLRWDIKTLKTPFYCIYNSCKSLFWCSKIFQNNESSNVYAMKVLSIPIFPKYKRSCFYTRNDFTIDFLG